MDMDLLEVPSVPSVPLEFAPRQKRCYYDAMGACLKGETCDFLHLGNSGSQNGKDFATDQNGQASAWGNGEKKFAGDAWRKTAWNGQKSAKLRFCTYSQSTSCCYGEDCWYPHVPWTEVAAHKTALCGDFLRNRACLLGDSCPGAHGREELRTPEQFEGTPGYKRSLCALYMIKGLTCDADKLCYDAHGELDLRREPVSAPSLLGVSRGAALECIAPRVEIWSSVTEWEIIGQISPPSRVTAAGMPENCDGYTLIPIQPRGAVELRYLKVLPSSENEGEVERFTFSDAHLHLDQVILSRRYGTNWFYKNTLCRNQDCFYGGHCNWAHGEEDQWPRPTYSRKDFEEIVGEIKGVPGGTFGGCIHSCCGTDTIEESVQLVAWGRELLDGRVYASFGIHPTTFEQYTPEVERLLEEALLRCGRQGVAWGECGLDYNKRAFDIQRDPSVKVQMGDVFRRQARAALRLKVPLVVHSRDAVTDVMVILKEVLPPDHPVHLHSFMGAPAEATEFLAAWPRSCIGIPGAITWPVAVKMPGGLGDLVRAIPLDRLLLETDGPFMAPVPHRGEESHPGLVPWIADGVARAKGISVREVLTATHANFCRLFSIPP